MNPSNEMHLQADLEQKKGHEELIRGLSCLNSQDPTDWARGQQLIKQSASLGNAEAQLRCGYFCLQENTPDYKQAWSYFERSAMQGHIESQLLLAECLSTGKIFHKSTSKDNMLKAVEWYEKAAAQGNKEAKSKAAEIKKILAEAERRLSTDSTNEFIAIILSLLYIGHMYFVCWFSNYEGFSPNSLLQPIITFIAILVGPVLCSSALYMAVTAKRGEASGWWILSGLLVGFVIQIKFYDNKAVLSIVTTIFLIIVALMLLNALPKLLRKMRNRS